MNFLNNRAIKQLIDSMEAAAITDLVATKIAKLNESGKSITYIKNAVTSVLGTGPNGLGFTSSEIMIFVQAHLQDDTEKYDGYGPNGFQENTGFLYMTVSGNKNAEEKIVRTVSVGFNTIIGQPQDFNVPQKVMVTEI